MTQLRARVHRAGALFATLAFILPLFAAMLAVAPIAALAADPAPGGATSAATQSGSTTSTPVETIHLTSSKTPPQPTEAELAGSNAATQKANRPTAPVPEGAGAQTLTSKPKAASTNITQPSVSGESGKLAGSDGVVYQNNTNSGAHGGNTSGTDEPSVAQNGNTIFYTGNWYASYSTDGGNTWTFVNPYTGMTGLYGGFCCDQKAYYIPGADLFVWTKQFVTDVNNGNAIRVLVAHGTLGVTSGTWQYFDLVPSQVGWPVTTTEYDYPTGLSGDVANVFFGTNVFLNGSTGSSNSTGFRLPISNLNALTTGNPLTYQFFNAAVGMVPFQQVGGTTGFFGTHASTTSLSVWAWPDGNATPNSPVAIGHASYATGTHIATDPSGNNDFGRDDTRVKTCWMAAGVGGCMWDAAQGPQGLGNFPYPYVDVVRFTAGLVGIDQPIIYSPLTAYGFPSIAPNARGALGGNLVFDGGGNWPSSSVFINDDFTGGAWQIWATRYGVASSSGNRWGDYTETRARDGNGTSWVATQYTTTTACSGNCPGVDARYVSFGRQRDFPFGNQRQFLPGVDVNGSWDLHNSLATGGPPGTDITFNFGTPSDVPLGCDLDGNGTKTPVLNRDGLFIWSNSYVPGASPDGSFQLGSTGDVGLCGDFNGAGVDTFGVFRPSTGQFILSTQVMHPGVNTLSGTLYVRAFGNSSYIPIVGNWDNTGTTRIGLFANGTFYEVFGNFVTSPGVTLTVDRSVNFGSTGDLPVVGDFSLNGQFTEGIYRPSQAVFVLKDTRTPGATYTIVLGNTQSKPFIWG